MSAALLLLLIASSNVANVFLARVLDREREMAVRVALGANRLRVARLVATESAVACAIGGIIGLVVAVVTVNLLAAIGPESIPRLSEVRLDGIALVFALGVTVITGGLAGLIPVINLAGSEAFNSLVQSSRRSTVGRRGRRTRHMLVSVEVALALVLLIGAGLLLQTFASLSRVDPGFDTEKALTAEINLPAARYPRSAERREFYDKLIPVLEATPGILSAGAISVFPLSGNPGGGTSLHRAGATTVDEGFVNHANFRVVTPGYFRTMGMTLLAGRQYTSRDGVEPPAVAIINQTLASQLWPGQDPIGRKMFSGQPSDPGSEFEVIGLVADVRETSLGEAVKPEIFIAYPQFAMQEMVLLVRTIGDPDAMAKTLQDAVLSVDPNQPIEAVQSVDAILARSVSEPRFNMILLGSFAIVALLLSMIGIYGVTSQAVSSRIHEIGVRMALGADSSSILALIVTQGLVPTAIGIVFGLAIAFAGTRLLSGMLFGVAPTDPITFVAGAGVLVLAALAGSAVPALRAARVDPTRALAAE
ncbi:MAG: FtsX-like permease family protein [Gemmatimonadetes bacterium]|nr:FtsX-like permease family protein [Gemmatimonadota bacterium]